jgi:hypothetical protein
MAGKHNNSQGSQASPGADSVQERVVQRQVDTVEYVSQPEPGPNYARLSRLEELLTQITDETSESLTLRNELEALPPASSSPTSSIHPTG